MADLYDKVDQFWRLMKKMAGGEEELAERRKMFFRVYPIKNCDPHVQVHGRTMLQFATNDYLGLATHPEAIEAATSVVEEFGVGTPLGARPLTGTTVLHQQLESELAAFRGTEDCVVFNLGLGAMSGTIAILVGRRERVFVDAYAHGCVHDGARLCKGDPSWFRHNDMKDLEEQLKACPADQPKMIAVDGVYGMTGDLAPLPDLVELKNKYGARLFVDDAHGTGVLGDNGRGTPEYFGVEDEVDLHGGTFAKAFGTFGGYVAGPAKVMEYIRFCSPGFVLTKALPAGITSATIKTLELMQRMPERREMLWENLNLLRSRLRDAGFDIGNPQGAVTSIFARGMTALRVVEILQDEYDILANPVMYPAVPYGMSIVRMTTSALHTTDDVNRIVDALVEINRKIPMDHPHPSSDEAIAAQFSRDE